MQTETELQRGGGSSLWLGKVAGLVSGSKQSHLLSGPARLAGVEFLMVSWLPEWEGPGPPSHSCCLFL